MDELAPTSSRTGQGSRRHSQSQPKLPIVSPNCTARTAALDVDQVCASGWLSVSRGRDQGVHARVWGHTSPMSPPPQDPKAATPEEKNPFGARTFCLTCKNPAQEDMARTGRRFMASPWQQGRVRKPLVPRDHGDFKQLLLTINARSTAPARRRVAGPQSQCLRAVFLQTGEGRSCLPTLGQEFPGSPDPRKQRPDPTGETPERFPSTWDRRLGQQCGLLSQESRGAAVPSPYLFLGHGVDVLAVRTQHQVSQDGAALMGHDVLILQRLVLPLGRQVHQDLQGEQGGVSEVPRAPQPPPTEWDGECTALGMPPLRPIPAWPRHSHCSTSK